MAFMASVKQFVASEVAEADAWPQWPQPFPMHPFIPTTVKVDPSGISMFTGPEPLPCPPQPDALCCPATQEHPA